MVLDLVRKGLVFNREVVAMFPAIRQAKLEECKWLVGECSANNRVRATPTTPVYTDLFPFAPALLSRYVHLYYRTEGCHAPI
jgi:hypothetical protein